MSAIPMSRGVENLNLFLNHSDYHRSFKATTASPNISSTTLGVDPISTTFKATIPRSKGVQDLSLFLHSDYSGSFKATVTPTINSEGTLKKDPLFSTSKTAANGFRTLQSSKSEFEYEGKEKYDPETPPKTNTEDLSDLQIQLGKQIAEQEKRKLNTEIEALKRHNKALENQLASQSKLIGVLVYFSQEEVDLPRYQENIQQGLYQFDPNGKVVGLKSATREGIYKAVS